MEKISLSFALAILGSATSVIASADCAPEVKHRNQIVRVSGDLGIWFHEQVASCMLSDLKELRVLRKHFVLTEQRLTLGDEENVTLRASNDQLREALSETQNALRMTEERAADAERVSEREKRSRWLWGAGGVVAGVGLGLVIGASAGAFK